MPIGQDPNARAAKVANFLLYGLQNGDIDEDDVRLLMMTTIAPQTQQINFAATKGRHAPMPQYVDEPTGDPYTASSYTPTPPPIATATPAPVPSQSSRPANGSLGQSLANGLLASAVPGLQLATSLAPALSGLGAYIGSTAPTAGPGRVPSPKTARPPLPSEMTAIQAWNTMTPPVPVGMPPQAGALALGSLPPPVGATVPPIHPSEAVRHALPWGNKAGTAGGRQAAVRGTVPSRGPALGLPVGDQPRAAIAMNGPGGPVGDLPTAPGVQGAASGVYTVQPGDYLRKIAQNLAGDEMRWKQLLELNPWLVENPDLIRPGEKIILPPDW